MSKFIAATSLAALLANTVPIGARAEDSLCAGGPAETWASPEAVTSRLSLLIDKEFILGVDKGCYEAEIVINATTMIDVYVDPVSMEIVRIRTNGEEDS